MSLKPAADPMTDTPATPTLELIHEGAGHGCQTAVIAYGENNRYRVVVDQRVDFTDPASMAKLIVLAVNSHATLLHQRDALVKALEDCPLPSQSAPTGEFYGRFYAWYNGQREAALKVKGRSPMEHELKGGTLSAEATGVIGRCTCGWTTGHRFSSFVASNAFRDHKEETQERKRNRDQE